MTLPEFREFASIPRLSREMIVTEKIDGTNGVVLVQEDGTVVAGSRSRWIVPLADNFGFAKWVEDHAAELRSGLGFGTHFGEWWGSGIQRGYGLTKGEKRWSLFNVGRWIVREEDRTDAKQGVLPGCCSLVPVLYRGLFDTAKVDECLALLSTSGSAVVPGFAKPEGVVVFHVSGNLMFKKTIEKDEERKGKSAVVKARSAADVPPAR